MGEESQVSLLSARGVCACRHLPTHRCRVRCAHLWRQGKYLNGTENENCILFQGSEGSSADGHTIRSCISFGPLYKCPIC